MAKGKDEKGKSVQKPVKKPVKEPLKAVEDLAAEKSLQRWELAALRHATGWLEGKQVKASEFDDALERFRCRRQGSGKL
ncbi:MAG: hypothetical protein OEV42_14725 [Deltaproteobacteria bacterium]|nr:hypothetical protein [Deltaproteobacteria bacterium]